jgi:hypothetical protein
MGTLARATDFMVYLLETPEGRVHFLLRQPIGYNQASTSQAPANE